MRQYAYYPYARLLLALGRPQDASLLIDRLEGLARKEGRHVLLITTEVLRCLAASALQEQDAAMQHLRHAIVKAVPGRYLRRFLDEGPDIERLLRGCRTSPEDSQPPQAQEDGFIDELLQAFGQDRSWPQHENLSAQRAAAPAASPAAGKLIEPLSEQEQKVLRLLCAGLSNQDIAAQLVIGLGTVKWHVHNIYNKLGVGSRTQAAARAKDLSLL